ncbi:DUF2961 domain-containing protein [Paludisphaera mucosa]|uniref:DUF2961 domain-containing protein n=1 Tax=Paludisphaera mucosa TaxID=3030827 RepID=A0ABT6FH60_9BACT|nr:DUF2961 domain-containing protein [Paludisphaera mucosa]MDG3006900.1 DUF2961 domain-containing protein [Paludisphaera mucosa]
MGASRRAAGWAWVLGLGLIASETARAEEPPVIPVGADAYLRWDQWPLQRIGARAYMRSTYDRRGGNEGADASHFLYQERDDFNVTLDVEGRGVLYFARFNHWHGSPWTFEVDAAPHVVRETSTADPDHPAPGSVFLPETAFPKPLAWTWSDTKGADLSWLPIAFDRSFRMAYGRTHYGTGYYIYHLYPRGARLSRPLTPWDGVSPPEPAVLALIDRAGTDLTAGREGLSEDRGVAVVRGGATTALATLTTGPTTIRAVAFSVPKASALAFGRARLRVTWDGRDAPSIDAPVALFFGAGTFYNREGKEHLVKAFPMNVRFDADRVHLACHFPMPCFASARFELVGEAGTDPIDVRWTIRREPYAGPANHVGYFHASYVDHPKPTAGEDLTLLDTTKAEGGGDWSGSFVGTSFIFSHDADLTTLEGDPRFYFDDSQTPQAQGTGTEEWGGGGDYWGGRNMTLPFAGHPAGARDVKTALTAEDRIESAYRFLLADLMPFGRNARITLEHGGADESTQHYETVAYWYGLPSPSLAPTDALDVGDEASEKAHDYRSPDASPPVEIVSRYERGVDHVKDREIFPAIAKRGRTTRGTSEFTLKLDRANLGVLLRRTLDYAYPDQRAEVDVADVAADGSPGPWRNAGVWFLAGSNTCYYSNPKPELGAPAPVVQVSNRRFRDDEFLIPRDLTEGRTAVRIRVRFVPVARPLLPGRPAPDLAWSEIRYAAYSVVMPAFTPPPAR